MKAETSISQRITIVNREDREVFLFRKDASDARRDWFRSLDLIFGGGNCNLGLGNLYTDTACLELVGCCGLDPTDPFFEQVSDLEIGLVLTFDAIRKPHRSPSGGLTGSILAEGRSRV